MEGSWPNKALEEPPPQVTGRTVHRACNAHRFKKVRSAVERLRLSRRLGGERWNLAPGLLPSAFLSDSTVTLDSHDVCKRTVPKVSATILAERNDSRCSALAIALIVYDVCRWWRMVRTPGPEVSLESSLCDVLVAAVPS